jgi:hypothetical protein
MIEFSCRGEKMRKMTCFSFVRGFNYMVGLIVFLFLFAGLVFAGKIVPLDGPLRPHIIKVNEERVYIVDGITIYIYSLREFKLIKKFGKEGEGPQEFKERIYGLDIRPDFIIVNSEGRFSHFTKEGDFIKQASATSTGINYLPIGNYLVGMRMLPHDRTLYFAINLYDKKLTKIKELHRFIHPFTPRKPVNLTNVRVCSYQVYDNKIFIDKEGIIDVYDKDGEKLYSIDPGIEKIKITEEYKKVYWDFWKSNHVLRAEYNALKDRFKFPDYFSPIRNFQIIDGKIYILTYKEKAGKSEMLIYSLPGKLQKKALVPLTDVAVLLPQVYNFYTIKNGKIYTLIENIDSETWELHITGF